MSEYYDGFNNSGNGEGGDIPKTPKKTPGTAILIAVIAIIFVAAMVAVAMDISKNADNNNYYNSNGSSELAATSSEAQSELSRGDYSEVVTVPEVSEAPATELAELYDRCSQSCVTITCTVSGNDIFYGSYESTSLGSGFILTDDGYVVTNQHVIDGAKSDSVKVIFYDGAEFSAEIIGSDEIYDIAVLKIDAIDRKLVPIEIGNSDSLKVGDAVFAIGTPCDIILAGTLTYGVISGKERELEITNSSGKVIRTMKLIQTDATLNSGNSGGPLFNMQGQIVGINNRKLMNEYEGIGFSIPINGAVQIINELISCGEVTSGDSYVTSSAYLGIEVIEISEAVISEYKLPSDTPKGVLVVSVYRNTAVYAAGLSAFDVITEFNGVRVETFEALSGELAKYKSGETVTMKYYRPDRKGQSGENFEIEFKLDAAA